ncbi:DUF3575 domain-containing protein [Alistipes dispar]|uniref:DUF3575 domain-containing protein n=1 Tax=Alistipes dispar TaxID=2585119 RepID=UPI002FDD2941
MKNYLYETAVLLCLALLPGSGASAQERSALRTAGPRFAVRTNALYWATASLNAGFEVGLDPRTSWEVAGGYNPWTFGDNRKLKFWTAQTEFRYWLRRRFAGHFFGLHVLYADYNAGGVKLFGMGDRRYEGFLYGAGLSYGYQWVVGRRWNIEAMLGVGYIRSEYDRYVWKRCGRFLGSGRRNYFGPTRVGVSVGFMIR